MLEESYKLTEDRYLQISLLEENQSIELPIEFHEGITKVVSFERRIGNTKLPCAGCSFCSLFGHSCQIDNVPVCDLLKNDNSYYIIKNL